MLPKPDEFLFVQSLVWWFFKVELCSFLVKNLPVLSYPQCAAGDDEPMVSLVVGGRHPGHYFLDSEDFNDVVTRYQHG